MTSDLITLFILDWNRARRKAVVIIIKKSLLAGLLLSPSPSYRIAGWIGFGQSETQLKSGTASSTGADFRSGRSAAGHTVRLCERMRSFCFMYPVKPQMHLSDKCQKAVAVAAGGLGNVCKTSDVMQMWHISRCKMGTIADLCWDRKSVV